MNIIFQISSLFLGFAIATQAAINNQLKELLGNDTLLAALISFMIGTICLMGIYLLSGQRFFILTQLQHAKWWMLLGGVLGALFVFGTIWLTPRIGIAALFSLVIFGQITMSLILDQFGVLGLAPRPISLSRFIGALLVLIGSLCINFEKH